MKKIFKVRRFIGIVLLIMIPASVIADQQVVLVPAFDNMVIYASDNSQMQYTVYSQTNNGIGNNRFYLGYDYHFRHYASLIQFDLSALEGRAIVSASLQLYPVELAGDPYQASQNTDYEVRVIADPWNTLTVTWNNKPQYYTGYRELFDVPTGTYPKVIDVTQPVQLWVDGTYPNYGFYMTDAYNSGTVGQYMYATFFGSQESDATKVPRLVVTVRGGGALVPAIITPLLLD